MTSLDRGYDVRSRISQFAITFGGEAIEFNTVHVGRLIQYLDDLSYVAHHFAMTTISDYRLSAPNPRERLLEWNSDLEVLLPVRGEWTPIIRQVSYNSPFMTILQWGVLLSVSGAESVYRLPYCECGIGSSSSQTDMNAVEPLGPPTECLQTN